MHTIFKSYDCCGIALLLLLGVGCTKKSDCITIAEKREVNGNFYFYWEDQDAFTTTNNNPTIPLRVYQTGMLRDK